MKNFFVVLLCLSMLVLVACNITDSNDNNNINDQTNPNIPNEDNISNEFDSGEVPSLNINSFEEYEQHFQDMKMLPQGFVPYEAIKEIGEFKSLVVLCEYGSGLYNRGLYYLVDENGVTIKLHFQEFDENKINSSNIILSDYDKNDLRALDSLQTGALTQENLTYYYISGKLLNIQWISDNIHYTLSGTPMLGDYQMGNVQTLTQSILNLQTAASTINQFNANVSDCMKNQNNSSQK